MEMFRVCKKCRIYTLKDKCPNCTLPTSSPHPPRFSPEDTYGKYRRKLKLEIYRRKEIEGN